jgi:hypothetical protein
VAARIGAAQWTTSTTSDKKVENDNSNGVSKKAQNGPEETADSSEVSDGRDAKSFITSHDVFRVQMEVRDQHIARVRKRRAEEYEAFIATRRRVLVSIFLPLFVVGVINLLLGGVMPTFVRNASWTIAVLWGGIASGLFYLEYGFRSPPGPPHYGTDPAFIERFPNAASETPTVPILRETPQPDDVNAADEQKASEEEQRAAEPASTLDQESVVSSTVEAAVAIRFNEARQRLTKQIADLNRRGNLNLLIGIAISLGGMAVLAQYIYSQDFSVLPRSSYYDSTPPDYMLVLAKKVELYAVSFLPRLTFVLVMELFAYFFLRLYKASLSEVKYFQNEITNMEAKHFALRVALETRMPATLLTKVVSSLVETERNHVLEKGQTTVDLEIAKVERQGVTDALKNVTSAVEKLTKKTRKP